MYLSRLILDPRSRRTQSELTSPYELHRTLLRAFPDDLTEERVLFRVDIDRRTGAPTVLVQSQGPPDWSFLSGTKGYLLDGAAEDNPAHKEVTLRLQAGQVLAYRLRANPTVKRDGKRLGLFDEQDQLDWLRRKAEQGGFRLLSAAATPEGFSGSRKRASAGAGDISHYAVRFDGHLQVLDPALLHETIAAGIGPAKGFGFGLLSLAKA